MPSSSVPRATKSGALGFAPGRELHAWLRALIILPSLIRLRAARFIGDWPCLADTMIAVRLKIPRLVRASTIFLRDESMKSSALLKTGPGVAPSAREPPAAVTTPAPPPFVLEIGSFWDGGTVWKFMPKIAGVPGLPVPSWRWPLIQLMTASTL